MQSSRWLIPVLLFPLGCNLQNKRDDVRNPDAQPQATIALGEFVGPPSKDYIEATEPYQQLGYSQGTPTENSNLQDDAQKGKDDAKNSPHPADVEKNKLFLAVLNDAQKSGGLSKLFRAIDGPKENPQNLPVAKVTNSSSASFIILSEAEIAKNPNLKRLVELEGYRGTLVRLLKTAFPQGFLIYPEGSPEDKNQRINASQTVLPLEREGEGTQVVSANVPFLEGITPIAGFSGAEPSPVRPETVFRNNQNARGQRSDR